MPISHMAIFVYMATQQVYQALFTFSLVDSFGSTSQLCLITFK